MLIGFTSYNIYTNTQQTILQYKLFIYQYLCGPLLQKPYPILASTQKTGYMVHFTMLKKN